MKNPNTKPDKAWKKRWAHEYPTGAYFVFGKKTTRPMAKILAAIEKRTLIRVEIRKVEKKKK